MPDPGSRTRHLRIAKRSLPEHRHSAHPTPRAKLGTTLLPASPESQWIADLAHVDSATQA
eukprot:8176190-Pyramimonas_sp.AAC.1